MAVNRRESPKSETTAKKEETPFAEVNEQQGGGEGGGGTIVSGPENESEQQGGGSASGNLGIENKEEPAISKEEKGRMASDKVIKDLQDMLLEMRERDQEKDRMLNEFMQKYDTMQKTVDILKQKASGSGEKSMHEMLDEILDKPVMFFAFGTHLSFFNSYYSAKHKRKLSPSSETKCITFKSMTRKHNKLNNGRGVQTTSICVAAVNMQSDLEYMRNHPDFNVLFFERQQNAIEISKNPQLVDYMRQASNSVKYMNPVQISRFLTERNMTISEDIDECKLAVTKKMAEELELSSRKTAEEKAIQDFMTHESLKS